MTASALRVCVITSSFPASPRDGGAAAGLFVKDFCLALVELGHQVVVLTPDKLAPKEATPGLTVHWFPWLGGQKPLAALRPHNPLDAVAMLSLFRQGVRAVDALAAAGPIDQILAMWTVPAGLLGLRLKRRCRAPLTTWCLGSDIWTYGRYPLIRRVVARVLRESDHLLADGLKLADDAARLAGRPCRFLPSSRRLTRAPVAPPPDSGAGVRFVFVGRYARVKGVDVLMEAMSRFLAAGGTGRLRLLGGGPMQGWLERRAAGVDLAGNVTVEGYADAATVLAALSASDCVIIPSRMESIPVILSDAMQVGRPVIASDVGDMGTLLSRHPAGRAVPPSDPAALATAMLQVAASDRESDAEPLRSLAAQLDVSRAAATWVSIVTGQGADDPGDDVLA